MQVTDLLTKKKILVITLGYPHPRRGASSVLFYCYLDALRKSDFSVEHLLLVPSDELSEQAEDEYIKSISPGNSFRVRSFAVPTARKVNIVGFGLRACDLPCDVFSHVKLFQPDAVICFDILAAEFARRMQLEQLLIWLGDLSFQTCVYHAYYDFKTNPRKIARLLLSFLFSLYWKGFYSDILRNQQHIIVSSGSSVATLNRMGIASRYWPYPWPAQISNGSTVIKHSTPSFILFGSLVGLGSRSAFDFLLKSIYPLLLRNWGPQGFSILLAGMYELPVWVQADIERRPEFKFLGFVNDLRDEVARSHAVLAPISVPVGNRSRIVTAMSMGALVIAHANTALGNPALVSGDNCLLASSAIEFSQHMRLAYESPDLAAKLGASAMNTYKKSFLPEAASQRLVQELSLILSR